MKNLSRQKPIPSALIMCRPELKGFFYSPFIELGFQKFFQLIIKGERALWLGTVHSPLGSSALIILSHSTSEMKKKSLSDREKELLKGLELAENLGAKKIALAGLLPSLLNHFHNIKNKELIKRRESLIKGQIITCLAIVKVFEKLLQQTNCQVLSILGLGAIGTNCLHLFLEKIAKPQKIILCDVLKRKAKLQKKALDIQQIYSIPTDIALYGEDSFLKVYEGDLLLGAVSSKNVLNPLLLKPGAVLVDDSFPPLVSIRDSINRMKKKKDILILSGGRMKLSSCAFQSELWQIPQKLISFFIKQVGNQGLPGCWLEALLSEQLKSLLNSKQNNQPENKTEKKAMLRRAKQATEFLRHNSSIEDKLLQVWELKENLNLALPDFHFFKYKIPSEIVSQVRNLRQQQFGKQDSNSI